MQSNTILRDVANTEKLMSNNNNNLNNNGSPGTTDIMFQMEDEGLTQLGSVFQSAYQSIVGGGPQNIPPFENAVRRRDNNDDDDDDDLQSLLRNVLELKWKIASIYLNDDTRQVLEISRRESSSSSSSVWSTPSDLRVHKYEFVSNGELDKPKCNDIIKWNKNGFLRCFLLFLRYWYKPIWTDFVKVLTSLVIVDICLLYSIDRHNNWHYIVIKYSNDNMLFNINTYLSKAKRRVGESIFFRPSSHNDEERKGNVVERLAKPVFDRAGEYNLVTLNLLLVKRKHILLPFNQFRDNRKVIGISTIGSFRLIIIGELSSDNLWLGLALVAARRNIIDRIVVVQNILDMGDVSCELFSIVRVIGRSGVFKFSFTLQGNKHFVYI
ncbi:transcription factor 12 isoform X17 [Vespula squamosa]|uniref:Transcription factor 12 isoform X17 n=1 Tax=Vespula squamosa TaxID=30214 RepID=A0ABD1ZZ33_VESSQ